MRVGQITENPGLQDNVPNVYLYGASSANKSAANCFAKHFSLNGQQNGSFRPLELTTNLEAKVPFIVSAIIAFFC